MLPARIRRRLAAVTVCLLLGSAQAQQGQPVQDTLPELNNYAWGYPVQADERASFYRVTLPLRVYRSLTDAEGRDLGVYNAAGQAVPRVLETGNADVEQQDTRHLLPFAALYRNQVPDADRVRMMFEQMGGETRIEVSSDSANGKVRPPLSGYIADTRQLEGSVDALEFRWPDSVSGFVGRVTVLGSNDLESWQTLGGAALADLREADADITQRRVSLADDDYDFLRIEWRDLPIGWALESLTAIQVASLPQIEREFLALAGGSDAEAEDAAVFDAGAALRVDRVRLLLEEDNAVVTAAIRYRLPGRERWLLAHEGPFYNLVRDELPVSSQPVAVPPVRAAEWKVDVVRGRPDTPFKLELGWRADVLLFVAQGSPPYTLAVGRDGAAEEGFPEERLLGEVSLGDIATDNGPVAEATLGERFQLGGIKRALPAEPIDWRTVLLWGGLVAAVLFVLWMALRVQRRVADS